MDSKKIKNILYIIKEPKKQPKHTDKKSKTTIHRKTRTKKITENLK